MRLRDLDPRPAVNRVRIGDEAVQANVVLIERSGELEHLLRSAEVSRAIGALERCEGPAGIGRRVDYRHGVGVIVRDVEPRALRVDSRCGRPSSDPDGGLDGARTPQQVRE